jgi:hypothetical protein
MGLRPTQGDEGVTWRAHSCVPCSHSCEHLFPSAQSVHMSVNAARKSARATRTPSTERCHETCRHAPSVPLVYRHRNNFSASEKQTTSQNPNTPICGAT